MPNSSSLPPFLLNKKVWVIAAVVVFLLAVVWPTIKWVNDVDNKGYEKQRDVVTLYQGVKTTLSNCLDKSMQSAGIADRERSSLKDLMIGTAYARAGSGSDSGGSVLDFNAVREAYPAASPELYRQLMTTVNGCRDEVAGTQRNLQAFGGEFQKWAETGGPIEKMLRGRYPTDELTAVNGEGKTISGIEALDFIVTPIILGSAEDASRTKEMPTQQLFPSSSPTNS